MSADLRGEVADLLADVRALLEDAALRGAVDDAPEHVPSPEERAARVAAAPGASGDHLNRWAAIAEADRSSPLPAGDALARVREELGDCRRCGLCQGRRNIVFGVGDPDADLVVVGEGPGQQEDLRGEPFVGPAGEMLDKMLANVIGLERSQVYICNVVKCRPPKNRNPEPDEVAACMPFLERQLEAVRPKLILVLGSVAFRSLFGVDQGIKANRGRWRTWRDVPVLPTFHPAYLLRQPQDKRLVFEDLKEAKARYDALGGRR